MARKSLKTIKAKWCCWDGNTQYCDYAIKISSQGSLLFLRGLILHSFSLNIKVLATGSTWSNHTTHTQIWI